jgi:DNA polymerase-3 subunit beta
MSLDLTVAAPPLAEAGAQLLRLLPVRSTQPALAGVLLHADADGLVLCATDGDLWAQVRVPAFVHADGEAVVSRRRLADTLAVLDVPELRVSAQGSRLAVRTPHARFALPQLDVEVFPRPTPLPAPVGVITGASLKAAAAPVASAASHEDALPLFTGVRIRSRGERLSLLATDRYRMAAAELDWQPTEGGGGLDTLVPASLVAEICRQVGRVGAVSLHAGEGRMAWSWAGWTVVVTSLAVAFPDQQLDRLLSASAESTVQVEADALSGAVRRASQYAGARGAIAVVVGDGQLRVCGSDPLTGESEETVKADCSGDRLTRHYQARYLLDALKSCSGQAVCIEIQSGLRPTVFTAVQPQADVSLRYLVVPLRTAASTG